MKRDIPDHGERDRTGHTPLGVSRPVPFVPHPVRLKSSLCPVSGHKNRSFMKMVNIPTPEPPTGLTEGLGT